jgi:predicted translin family RNA/ssDNA-binding protein
VRSQNVLSYSSRLGLCLRTPMVPVAEYQSAVDFLKGVEATVQGVEKILQNHPYLTFQAAFQEYVANLITAVAHFRTKVEGYDT